MKHQRFKLIIFISNDSPVLILTYFTAGSDFSTSVFMWENVAITDTLEIIASCGLDFGLLCIRHFNQVLYDLFLYYSQIPGKPLHDHWFSGLMLYDIISLF